MFEYRIKNPLVRQKIETAEFKLSLEVLAAQLHSQGSRQRPSPSMTKRRFTSRTG